VRLVANCYRPTSFTLLTYFTPKFGSGGQDYYMYEPKQVFNHTAMLLYSCHTHKHTIKRH